jgi:hypothetical protein
VGTAEGIQERFLLAQSSFWHNKTIASRPARHGPFPCSSRRWLSKAAPGEAGKVRRGIEISSLAASAARLNTVRKA